MVYMAKALQRVVDTSGYHASKPRSFLFDATPETTGLNNILLSLETPSSFAGIAGLGFWEAVDTRREGAEEARGARSSSGVRERL